MSVWLAGLLRWPCSWLLGLCSCRLPELLQLSLSTGIGRLRCLCWGTALGLRLRRRGWHTLGSGRGSRSWCRRLLAGCRLMLLLRRCLQGTLCRRRPSCRAAVLRAWPLHCKLQLRGQADCCWTALHSLGWAWGSWGGPVPLWQACQRRHTAWLGLSCCIGVLHAVECELSALSNLNIDSAFSRGAEACLERGAGDVWLRISA